MTAKRLNQIISDLEAISSRIDWNNMSREDDIKFGDIVEDLETLWKEKLR